jgi:hypothetical protein
MDTLTLTRGHLLALSALEPMAARLVLRSLLRSLQGEEETPRLEEPGRYTKT